MCFERVHQETFGKTGCRRIVPGQFLAVDPKGRAILIGECFGVSYFNWFVNVINFYFGKANICNNLLFL